VLGHARLGEERNKGRFSKERDFGVGTRNAKGAQKGQSHHDIAQPIWHAYPVAGFAR